jgi:hypothetical protein
MSKISTIIVGFAVLKSPVVVVAQVMRAKTLAPLKVVVLLIALLVAERFLASAVLDLLLLVTKDMMSGEKFPKIDGRIDPRPVLPAALAQKTSLLKSALAQPKNVVPVHPILVLTQLRTQILLLLIMSIINPSMNQMSTIQTGIESLNRNKIRSEGAMETILSVSITNLDIQWKQGLLTLAFTGGCTGESG